MATRMVALSMVYVSALFALIVADRLQTQCFCGSSLVSGATSTSSSNCNYACAGGGTNTCGGFYYINVYHKA
ncbi:hypothetical protein DFH07DRAFT_849884 [Mycena maculata]|uniref:WSC domain-containing protein n=1 Tax=Mycena maculata TaxID=230809 RepID=A0AAD7HW53_9AGAR|nr:hypothetical protein DFH07DRAFT_849884 [Mycena maculata]